MALLVDVLPPSGATSGFVRHEAGREKFPYLVHYHIDEGAKEVTIIAVYGSWQKPLWE